MHHARVCDLKLTAAPVSLSTPSVSVVGLVVNNGDDEVDHWLV